MKKILSFLLVATMLCAMFVVPSAAEGTTANQAQEFKDLGLLGIKAPKVDGVIKKGEYGDVIHTWDGQGVADNDQFMDSKGHTVIKDWSVDFYATWDADNLYLAWEVNTPNHGTLPAEQTDLGYMWMYSCIQLVLTPTSPVGGEDFTTTKNYLEYGFCQNSDKETKQIAWAYPSSVKSPDLTKWDSKVSRDDTNQTTSYELRIPWNQAGVQASGTDAQFGLAYAVGAQVDYNVTPGMVEWQDVILTGGSDKKASNCAVITLKSKEQIDDGAGQKKPGNMPEDIAALPVEDRYTIDKVNEKITGDDASLLTGVKDFTDADFEAAKEETPDVGYNLMYTQNWLLEDIGDGQYKLVENVISVGSIPVFETKLTKNHYIVAFHSDDTIGITDAGIRKINAAALEIGTVLKAWGLDPKEGKAEYTNACLYVVSRGINLDSEVAVVAGDTVKILEAGAAADAADLKKAYVLEFAADGNIAYVGYDVAAYTVAADSTAIIFTDDEANEGLKSVYDEALGLAETTASENGLFKVIPSETDVNAVNKLVKNEDGSYTIVRTYTAEPTPGGDDNSTSDDNSSAPAPDNSTTTTSSDASAASSVAEESEGMPVWLIIVIVVVVLAAVAVVVVVVLKKKKA